MTYVGEVGNTATNEEDLALSVHGCAEHEVENSAGVVEGLGLGGGTRVLAVVGELTSVTSRGNGISIDDRSTTTSNESPDATSAVENGELEGSTSLCVHLSNVCLLLAHLTTERRGEVHGRASVNIDLAILGSTASGDAESGGRTGNGPLDTALELGGLVNLGGKIEEVDVGGGDVLVGNDDERVDLEVSELAVDVDGVKTGNEVNKDVVDTGRHLAEKALGDLLVAGVLLEVDGNQELLSLSVNITDLNTTLVVEENPVTLGFELAEFGCFVWCIATKLQNCIRDFSIETHLTDGVDVDVILGLLGVGHERLNEESPQVTLNVLNLLELVCALCNPGLGLGPGSVELEQTRLASPLDELIGLCDELGTGSEEEGECGLGGVKDALDVVTILEGDGSELRRRVVGCLCGKRSGLDHRRAGEVVVEDGLAVGLED